MHAYLKNLIFLTFFLITTHSVFAQGAQIGIAVRGDVLKPSSWSVDDLKRQFAKEVQTVKLAVGEDKQQKAATGIPLFSLINAAELITEKTPKHYDLSFIVIVEASDAYRVFFSLAELMPKNGQPQVWLVWEMDGKPLSGKEAPLRLVSTDRGADRSIYGIGSITLVDGIKLASRLASGK
jgi:DMSO/TMAO reductase YedYZ molybdopterin-dependent catalytic subunit